MYLCGNHLDIPLTFLIGTLSIMYVYKFHDSNSLYRTIGIDLSPKSFAIVGSNDGQTNANWTSSIHISNSNYGKKKYIYIYLSVFYTQVMKKTLQNLWPFWSSVKDLSNKWDFARCPSFIRLEMVLVWRQVVRNLRIHYRIFIALLHLNIESKRIELKTRSWRHFKEKLKIWSWMICSCDDSELNH